jgi:hypothetical protein
MAQTSGPVARLGPVASAPKLGLTAAKGSLSVSRAQPAFQHTVALDWFLGSGRVGRSCLFANGGSLFQFPFSSYAATGGWQASPGFQNQHRFDFNRAVQPACLQCHSSILPHSPVEASQLNGISCERCHGPGERHVRQPQRSTIVNPTRLPPAHRDSVCSQCHLTGAARVATLRGEREAYLPGQNLADFLAVFVSDTTGAKELSVTGHTERLAASRCKQASGDKLWCVTCHDPHSEPVPAARATYYRAKCESCHATKSPACKSDCVSCHMPKAPTQGIDHSASTDHAILRRATAKSASKPLRIRPFLGAPGLREEALAWAILAAKDPTLTSAAIEKLRAIPEPDSAVHLQLAQLLPPGVEQGAHYEAALPLPAAAVNMGILRAQSGRLQDAAVLWRDALDKEPYNSAARLNLAQSFLRTNQPARALAELNTLLSYDPDRLDIRRLIAQLKARLQ